MTLPELSEAILLMVAQAADENGVDSTTADDWYDRLAESVDLGLDTARER